MPCNNYPGQSQLHLKVVLWCFDGGFTPYLDTEIIDETKFLSFHARQSLFFLKSIA